MATATTEWLARPTASPPSRGHTSKRAQSGVTASRSTLGRDCQMLRGRRGLVCGGQRGCGHGHGHGHGQKHLDRLAAPTGWVRHTKASAAPPAAEAAEADAAVGEMVAAWALAETRAGGKPVGVRGHVGHAGVLLAAAGDPAAAKAVEAAEAGAVEVAEAGAAEAAEAGAAEASVTSSQAAHNDSNVMPVVPGRRRRRRSQQQRQQPLMQNHERHHEPKHQDGLPTGLQPSPSLPPPTSAAHRPSAASSFSDQDRRLSGSGASTSGRTWTWGDKSVGGSSSSSRRRFRRAVEGVSGVDGVGGYPPSKHQHQQQQPTTLASPSPQPASTPAGPPGVDVGLEHELQQLQLLQMDLDTQLAQEPQLQWQLALQAPGQLQPPAAREPILELQSKPRQRPEGGNTQPTAKAQEGAQQLPPPQPSAQQRWRKQPAPQRQRRQQRRRQFEQKEQKEQQQQQTQSMKLELATRQQQVQEHYRALGKWVSRPSPAVQGGGFQGGFGAAEVAAAAEVMEPPAAASADSVVEHVVPSTREVAANRISGSAEKDADVSDAPCRRGSGSAGGGGGGGGGSSTDASVSDVTGHDMGPVREMMKEIRNASGGALEAEDAIAARPGGTAAPAAAGYVVVAEGRPRQLDLDLDPRHGPGRRGLPRQAHLRVVHDERHGPAPEGLTEVRAVELTVNIRHAATLEQLRDILDSHGDVFNAINITAFAARLAQLATLPGQRPMGQLAPPASAEGLAMRGEALESPDGWESVLDLDFTAAAEVAEAEDAEADVEADEVGGAHNGPYGERHRVIQEGPEKHLARRLASRLGDLVQARILDMDPEGVVTLLYVYGRLSYRHDVLADLVFVAGQNMELYHSQAISNLVWAMATLLPHSATWAARGWWEGLFLCTEDRLGSYSTQALANIVWALGRLHKRPPLPWQRAFFHATAQRLHLFTSQGVASYVQGVAKLGMRLPEQLLEGLRGYGAAHLHAFSAQGLVLYVWGMAKLTANAQIPQAASQPWLTKAVLPELYRRLPSLDLRQLATALYSLAVMRHRPPWSTFMRRYWKELLGKLQALANILHAAAELRLELPPAVFTALMAATLRRLRSYPPEALSSTAWSLHRLGLAPDAVWRAAFLERCWYGMPYMSVSELATMMYGTSRLPGMVPEREWLVRAEGEWLQNMDRSTSVDLYRGISAFAHWQHSPGPHWQEALIRQLSARLPDIPTFQLSHLVGFLGEVGCTPPLPLVNSLVRGAVTGRAPSTADLAKIVYGLARMNRMVSPELLSKLLADLTLLRLDLDLSLNPPPDLSVGASGAAVVTAVVASPAGVRTVADSRTAPLASSASASSKSVPMDSTRRLQGLGSRSKARGGQVKVKVTVNGKVDDKGKSRRRGREGGGRCIISRGERTGAAGAGEGGEGEDAASSHIPTALEVLKLPLLVGTVWSLARLHYAPAVPWVSACATALGPALPSLGLHQLGMLLEAWAEVGPEHRPGKTWMAAAKQRLRVLEEEVVVEGDGDGVPVGLAAWSGGGDSDEKDVLLGGWSEGTQCMFKAGAGIQGLLGALERGPGSRVGKDEGRRGEGGGREEGGN